MLEILLEAAIIIGIVLYQGYIFLQNRQKISRLAALYPDKQRLQVKKELVLSIHCRFY